MANPGDFKCSLTVPGGNIASKRSTPNIPRLDRVKVPVIQANNNGKQKSDKVVVLCNKRVLEFLMLPFLISEVDGRHQRRHNMISPF